MLYTIDIKNNNYYLISRYLITLEAKQSPVNITCTEYI